MTRNALTVGRLAELTGVTVRTLHHYDDIGLLTPSSRSSSGYRLHTDDDVPRRQQIIVYRRPADMYVADERFTATYEEVTPGLARYVRDAIHANSDRQETIGRPG
ncbi:MAG: MerR family transcriptional regulator [Gordonia sp. (in: high G+C Gram-positive bacteria)]